MEELKTSIDWDQELIHTTQFALQGLLVGRIGANSSMVQSQLATAAIEIAEIIIRQLKQKIDGK